MFSGEGIFLFLFYSFLLEGWRVLSYFSSSLTPEYNTLNIIQLRLVFHDSELDLPAKYAFFAEISVPNVTTLTAFSALEIFPMNSF